MQLTTEYFYDELNQLIRENDPVANKTITYTYDDGGNILQKNEYEYTTSDTLGSSGFVIFYAYDSEWKDLLTSYGGLSITYDEIGNPLTFDDTTLTWERGRKLSSMTFPNGVTASYKYDANGIRTQKTVGSRTTEYFLEGSTIVAQKTGDDVIWYYFDSDGTRDAIEYKGNVYYYMYNPQGDVIGLFDDELNVVVEYTYDSWGKILSITGPLQYSLGRTNPFRYRGYYYDNESGMYYLNSRYYHPEIGRFINADGYVQTGQGILDKNMFAYCMNNPVNMADYTGYDPVPIWAKNIVYGTPTEADYLMALSCNPGAWAGSAGYIVRKAVAMAEGRYTQESVLKVKEKPNMTPRKDKRHGSEKRKPTGERERNVAHPNSEEHSRVAKGNGIRKIVAVGVLVGATIVTFGIVADDITGVGAVNDVMLAPTTAIWWDAAKTVLV